MWRNLASNLLTIMVVLLVAAFAVVGWGQSQYAAEGPLTAPICLEVPSGYSMRRVAADLSEQGAISNATIYRLGADYSGKATQLKAGSFLIEEGASMAEIVDAITGDGRSTCGVQVQYLVGVAGQAIRVRSLDTESQEFVTIAEFDPAVEDQDTAGVYAEVLGAAGTEVSVIVAEGVTSWQIVNALQSWGYLDGEVAEIPVEGTLAPDGYEVASDTTLEEFLAGMAALQSERLAAAWENRADGIAVETPEEALILASIIEKETAIAEERRVVASVFTNRLRQGIKLQTDPTVIYGVTEGKGVLGRGIRQSELRRETPWNTYVIEGLPVTPIANPGLASIEAALNPDETDFIYFVAKTLDPRDGHNFAVTLREHNANVEAYRTLERANQ